jgi:glycosyltransferase involved in cell wall biosynthesis
MKITLLTQYFPPEIGATQTRMDTFATELAARGHEVRVICEVPNHPQGIVHEDYRRRLLRRREDRGSEVVHVWVRANPERTTRSLLAFYGSYMAMATAIGGLGPRPDVLLASSPPLPVAVAAAALAARHRVPWVMDVRDLWPEAAVALGELSNPRALLLAERLAGWLYRDAQAITAVTEPFGHHIAARAGDPAKVHIVPNGTTARWMNGAALDVDRATLGLASNEFLWVFAGNVGAAQGLESAVDAAELLGEGFRLLILGDGPARRGLEQRAARSPSARVEFREQVHPDVAVRYLRAADCLLVSLSAHPALRSFVPSKLYDCCAVGRPVVLAAEGEPVRLVEAHGAALPVPPGNPVAIAEAVRRLRREPHLGRRLAEAGHRFGAQNLRERHVDRLERILQRAGFPNGSAMGAGNGAPVRSANGAARLGPGLAASIPRPPGAGGGPGGG